MAASAKKIRFWAVTCMVCAPLLVGAANADRRPGPLPPGAGAGASSNAHRSDPRGNYGIYKAQRAREQYRSSTRDDARKQPYDYRYYSDTDRSPGSCRRYADRAIGTRNKNWWTRYRACMDVD